MSLGSVYGTEAGGSPILSRYARQGDNVAVVQRLESLQVGDYGDH